MIAMAWPPRPSLSCGRWEQASRALENDPDNTSLDGREWLRMFIAPGSSLGGALPKASVRRARSLWSAKFPGAYRDDYDVGAWELVVNALANHCGLRVATGIARRYSKVDHHCFMVKRFDRTERGGRLHFASAMTLTDRVDGDDASVGASYLRGNLPWNTARKPTRTYGSYGLALCSTFWFPIPTITCAIMASSSTPVGDGACLMHTI